MHQEAAETEQRCTELAGDYEGKKTAILEQTVLSGSLELAGHEDPNEPA